MKRFTITTYVSRPDSDANRYSYGVIESTITGKQLWVDHGNGDGSANLSALVGKAGVGYDQKQRNTKTDIPIRTFRNRRASIEGMVHEHEVTADMINALEHCEQDSRMYRYQSYQAELLNAMYDYAQRANGQMADACRALFEVHKASIEAAGQFVVSANGGNSYKLYRTDGKVGKGILAHREALKASVQ